MVKRIVIVMLLLLVSVNVMLVSGCANNAQTYAAYGGVGDVIIGAVAGGPGGAIVGGCIAQVAAI
ncbi:MAG: hypothetical protein ACYTE8_09670 [Planctomycetota bacterium]|jgi:hypothetical protein